MFDSTRWPYDPSKVDRHTFDQALSDLCMQVNDSIRLVERAIEGLQTSAGMIRSNDLERHTDVMGTVDRANMDVRRYMEDAMDAVYRAASVVDGLK
jgi:hypothetical protein